MTDRKQCEQLKELQSEMKKMRSGIFSVRCKECKISDGVGCLGAGHWSPRDYGKTVKELKSGKRAKMAKQFFEEHPDGATDVSWSFYICEKCGRVQTAENLSMYIPKEGYKNTGYPQSKAELEDKYVLYTKYPHKCCVCRGNVAEYSEDEIKQKLQAREAVCAYCGGELELEEIPLMFPFDVSALL